MLNEPSISCRSDTYLDTYSPAQGSGKPSIAVLRLSPQDFQFFNMQVATAGAHLIAGRYAEALSWAEAAVRAHPNYALSNGIAAASAAHAGRFAEAQKSVARMRSFQPDLRIADLVKVFPVRRPEHRSAWIEGLRKAGLPD